MLIFCFAFNPSVPAGHLPFQERLAALKPPLVRGGGAEHRRGCRFIHDFIFMLSRLLIRNPPHAVYCFVYNRLAYHLRQSAFKRYQSCFIRLHACFGCYKPLCKLCISFTAFYIRCILVQEITSYLMLFCFTNPSGTPCHLPFQERLAALKPPHPSAPPEHLPFQEEALSASRVFISPAVFTPKPEASLVIKTSVFI